MNWVEVISKALSYIETHITEDITVEDIAKEVNISAYYFQKGFSMLCGLTVCEYIRNRRLSLAGNELTTTKNKIIDIAFKYGYESPDSFTKAFTRFHGVTPSMVQKGHKILKTFAPLKIKLSIEGGYIMDYKIVKKEAFQVIGNSQMFSYANPQKEIPEFWNNHYREGKGRYVQGMFGINIDESMEQNTFEYLIADIYDSDKEVPDGFVLKTIPAFTWAIFPCVGSMPKALQYVNVKIFSEWLPALKDYEFAAGYCIEMYDDPSKYEKGTLDERYYSEIWIPIKPK